MDGISEPSGWSAEQRASEPFVFRSGGLVGAGRKAHTIRDAIKYMDGHPDDGIYHLQNGTFARWLAGEGARDMAHLAHAVVNAGYTDPRVMLETFLLGAGLAERPRQSVRPISLSLGYALAGQTAVGELHVRHRRGRGYLFGRAGSAAPWISLDPASFAGRGGKLAVNADTRSLSISAIPHEANIEITSSATEQPTLVPVRVRVTGAPSRAIRFALRPLFHALAAGLIGAALGWLLARVGVGLPGFASTLTLQPAALWAAAIGALWLTLGAIRGFAQPPAWPLTYALGRWLLRGVIWGGALAAITAVALWLWQRLQVETGLPPPADWRPALIGAGALAVLPAILGELSNTRRATKDPSIARRTPLLRPSRMIAALAVTCALVFVGARFLAPTLRDESARAAVSKGQAWSEQQLTRFDATLNSAIDRVYLELYDRRAPSATAVPTPAPPVSTSEPE